MRVSARHLPSSCAEQLRPTIGIELQLDDGSPAFAAAPFVIKPGCGLEFSRRVY